jgi:hypothetical protein
MENNILAQASSIVSDYVLRFFAAHAQDLATVRSGRKSAKAATDILQTTDLTSAMVTVFDENPVAGYVALAANRRDLTAFESLVVKNSSEADHQGVLACGEVAQDELFIMTHIRVKGDDNEGQAFVKEVQRVARMARAVAQQEKATLYLRYQANVVVRALRKGARAIDLPEAEVMALVAEGTIAECDVKPMKDRAKNTVPGWVTVAAKFTHNLRARFGGRLYLSDRAEHEGTLLAIITPNLDNPTPLGKVEWAVPGLSAQ